MKLHKARHNGRWVDVDRDVNRQQQARLRESHDKHASYADYSVGMTRARAPLPSARHLRLHLWLAVSMALCGVARGGVAPESIQVVTEYSPPFTDIGNDQEGGYATMPMRAIVSDAGFVPTITTLSWKAALDIVQSKPNVLIYPIARTPERENQFTWIGRLGSLHYSFYKLHSRHLTPPSGLDTLKQYRIAAVRRDIRENYLLAHGFQPGSNAGLIGVSDNIEAFQLLRVGRVDLAIFSPLSVAQICVNQQVDCKEFDVLMPLGLSTDLYLAGNRQMSADQAHRLQAAYKRLSANGTLKRITPVAFYGPD